MADNGIGFKRDGNKVTITVDLERALQGRTSKGNPGTYGQATIDMGPTDARLSLNVFQAKKKPQPVNL